MYHYKLNGDYKKYFPEINISNIETVPLNKNGFADILSINLEYNIKLKNAKNKIDELDQNIWEEYKTITNPYEYIYAYNNYYRKNDIKSVSLIKPLSRSFFKMIEMIYEFFPEITTTNTTPNTTTNTTNNTTTKSIITLHIAEGPGGFIEATRYIRNINIRRNNDIAFAITLLDKPLFYSAPINTIIPEWKQSGFFLKTHPEVIITSGEDNTGDITNPKNIIHLANTICTTNTIPSTTPSTTPNTTPNTSNNQLANIITADGGFDFSIEYNYQEQASCKLIFSEIIAALKCQQPTGGFICKMFDTISYFSTEMLYLLYICYGEIAIYKPFTSRNANSEKYIICRNFIGIPSEFLNQLINVLQLWNTFKDKTINYLFKEIPREFIENMKNINKLIIDDQIQNIYNTINVKINFYKQYNRKNKQVILAAQAQSQAQFISERFNEWKKEIKRIQRQQIDNAIEWCKKYNIPYKNI